MNYLQVVQEFRRTPQALFETGKCARFANIKKGCVAQVGSARCGPFFELYEGSTRK